VIGDLKVSGSIITAPAMSQTDDPLAPTSRYLMHAAVQSSEMLNIYAGNVTTDANGEAVVRMPEWFEALNGDFRYQLTVLGQFAQAIVLKEIDDHQFTIQTDKPNVKVSWQVTGVRHDAYAKAHPLQVEVEKPAVEQGSYLYPEAYGRPEEKSMQWARRPDAMKKWKELRTTVPIARREPPLSADSPRSSQ
jgi:hypothetical protein